MASKLILEYLHTSDNLSEDWTSVKDICQICGELLSEQCLTCKVYKNNKCVIEVSTCDHIFHKHCIGRWINKLNICPIDLTQWNPIKPQRRINVQLFRVLPRSVCGDIYFINSMGEYEISCLNYRHVFKKAQKFIYIIAIPSTVLSDILTIYIEKYL